MQVAADAAMKNQKLNNEAEIKSAIKASNPLQGNVDEILASTTISYDPANYIVISVTYLGEKYPEDTTKTD